MTTLSDYYSAHKVLLASIATVFFILSWIVLIFITPVIVEMLPEDYFANPAYLEVESIFSPDTPFMRKIILFFKNISGWFLIIIGPILFQSIFAPFFGLLLANFKAKPKLIRKFVSWKIVWKALNLIRVRRNLPQFQPPVL